MAMSDWTNDITVQFLEFYQNDPVLWNPDHKWHKDKKKLKDAWLRISDLMNIPVEDLKRKKDSLMASYRSHLRKRKASIKSVGAFGEIYKPIWFAFEVMEEFLGPLYEGSNNINLENSIGENFEEEYVLTTAEGALAVTEIPTPTRRKLCPRSTKPPTLQETEKQMKEARASLNNVSTKEIAEEDECDLYARLLSKKLKKLPENERQLFMYEIDGLFIKRTRQQCLALPSCSPDTVPSPSQPSSSQPSYSDPSQSPFET